VVSKVDRARAALDRMLKEDNLTTSGRLPAERDLCEQLGVSRSTLRTALNLLEAEGKIWRRVGSGTYAGNTPPKELHGLLVISNATSPVELMELRLMIEPGIARLAAMRATRSEIEYLQHCVKKSFSATDSQSYELWDLALHNAVAASTHNQLIISTFKSINELRQMTLWGQVRDRIVADGAQRYWCSQHKAFVDAIADRDGERAERLARKHVEDVFSKISKT
jgi:DNA-binding FadR family transcriptional regulator